MKSSAPETLHTRRKFLRTSLLGGAVSLTLPVFLEKTFLTLDAMAADSAVQTPTGKDGPILVVLQLAGGNDGLNTVIPYGDDAYFRARPKIGIPASQVLKVSDYIGFNPKLSGLRGLYDQGNLAVMQGVGYPNPNRSHFRSTDIWQTASDANKYETQGWLGRYFDACCKGADPTVGVSIGSQQPKAFNAAEPMGISFSRPDQFRFMAEKTNEPKTAEELYLEVNEPEMAMGDNSGGSIDALAGSTHTGGSTLDFLRRTALDAQLSSEKVLAITSKHKSTVSYPSSQIGSSLNLVGRFIAGGLPTRVYYVSQGGFDTHANQGSTHERLMGELDEALTAFVSDLKAQGNFDRVLLMTFSEFGRRVAENASGGTDHGAAAPLFVVGGKIKPGLYGQYPSLSKLSDGDLIYNLDFRNIYATVLEKWLHAPSKSILDHRFPTLPFV